MEFEWDNEKFQKTQAERGLNFNDATPLWEDPESIEIPARSETELRWAKIGRFNNQVYTAVFTLRGKKIRIISMRRSSSKEAVFYGQK